MPTMTPRMPRHVLFLMTWWVAGCIVALAETPFPGLPTELWPPVGVGFILLTLVWDGKSRPDQSAIGMAGAMAASFFGVALVFSHPVVEAAFMAVSNTSAAVLMTLAYAVTKDQAGWAPRRGLALLGMVLGAIVASGLLALVGGFPDLAAGRFEPLTLWWTIRSTIFAFIGGATFLIFFHGDRERWRRTTPPSRLSLALLVVVSPICVFLVFVDPELPLTWFLLLPAVAAGVSLTPFGAAVHALAQALTAGAMAFLPFDQFAYVGVLPPSLLVDLLLAVSTFITIQIALLRDERERANSAEQELRQQADARATLLGQVFDSMSDGMMLFSWEGDLLRYNPAVRHIFGRPIPETLTPGLWVEFLGLCHEDGTPVQDNELPGGPGLRRHQITAVIGRGGDRRFVEMGSWPISDSEILVLVADVTDQRRRTAELAQFAGVVAHDLRTPLMSLRGLLELAAYEVAHGKADEVAPLIERAEGASARMERVVEGWINYTLVREGRLTPENVSLADVAEDVCGTYRESPHVGTRIAVRAPHFVRADRGLTRQLIANLVANAVKFSPPGTPAHIEITSTDDTEAGWVRVEVADRGVGIPTGQEHRIFEEFHRAPGRSTRIEGTGLGLSLCHSIVTRHGGTISATNNEHGGATITFTLPVAD